MESLVADISLAIVAFASTSIDDIFVLVAFFSDRSFGVHDVVIGQYIGVGTLYTVSVIAALISLIIPPASVGLLGLAPIAIGTRKLVGLMRGQKKGRISKCFDWWDTDQTFSSRCGDNGKRWR